jgi:hypothetical protein
MFIRRIVMTRYGISIVQRKGRKSQDERRGQARHIRLIPKREHVRFLTDEDRAKLPNYQIYREVIYKDLVGFARCPFCGQEYMAKNDRGIYGRPADDFLAHHTVPETTKKCVGSQRRIFQIMGEKC